MEDLEKEMSEYFSRAAETYKAPEGARNAAKKAIAWKEKYGKEVKGGTIVGWTRAGQLARNENLTLSTVKRMYSFFSRHEGNFRKAQNKEEYKSKPWTIPVVVAWMIWGGDAGYSWSAKIAQSN